MNLKHEPVDLAIVGGGAAGLFAAASAASRKVGCLVFERKARVGSKMLMTANGRCNFTKEISAERMLADVGEPCASFLAPALSACPPSMVAAGFRARGLRVKRMTDGRLFPASEKAADVVHVFGDLLRDEEIPLVVNCPVVGLQPMKNGFVVAAKRFTVWARNVLVATGGMSFPKTGSVGDGQRFARELGLRVENCRAGLTGFETRDRDVLSLVGRRFENSSAAVVDADGRELFRASGEVEFEPWGVSGAAVYNCQRWIARHGAPRDWSLSLNLPSLPFSNSNTQTLKHSNTRTLSLLHPVARPLKEAIVTVGGVALDEIDPRTMQSRKIPGLYFAGEVLDVDGPTGGYNLTIAFATARLAVESVAASLRRGR